MELWQFTCISIGAAIRVVRPHNLDIFLGDPMMLLYDEGSAMFFMSLQKLSLTESNVIEQS